MISLFFNMNEDLLICVLLVDGKESCGAAREILS